ncbi:MAG: ferritin [Armatimonadetes bacterium]|nr:ferritin [Armatimonadota bacterium]
MASEGYHEPVEYLEDSTRDMHRAIQSMIEELEAITWYNQRIDASNDTSLQEVLIHNRDEEREHMAMLLEWVRRRDPCFDEKLRTYLFTEAPIGAIEEAAESGGAPVPEPARPMPRPRALTVGDLTRQG